MFNSTSLLLLQRSCSRWECEYWETLITFFHSLPYDSTQWLPIADSILILHGFLMSTASVLPSLLLPLLLSFTILFLPKLLWSLHHRNNTPLDRYVHVDEMMHEEPESAEVYYYISSDKWSGGKGDLVADVVAGGEDLLFLSGKLDREGDSLLLEQARSTGSSYCGEEPAATIESGACTSPDKEDDDLIIDIKIEDIPLTSSEFHTPLASITDEDGSDLSDHKHFEGDHDHAVDVPINEEMALEGDVGVIEVEGAKKVEEAGKLQEQEWGFLVPEEKAMEGDVGVVVVEGDKKVEEAGELQEQEEHLTDTCTNGSTSKSSCEWRGNFRDSETDGFFSSSSRRSSSQWESYTLHRKYDEEMMFFDRISSQKLKETESLRSIKVQPRSISERIVHKLSTKNKRRRGCSNPYQELEAAYVAQVCLAWEAISWNYNSFRQATSERRREDRGCPARVAQQFQQFLVLLQRFIENEPYEYGRRPEAYARLRISSPKLLQVPEFRGDDLKEEFSSRIPSPEFLKIMGDIIRTFIIFLKADKERHWQALKARILQRKPSSVDRNVLSFIIKANRKKKAKLKELQRGGSCMRKVKLKAEEEMKILMCLVDMKVVSRVLRMPEVSEQQLQWCEEKMRKVRFWNGRVQRDSTPLFFPEH